jgi:hypothetical protein
MDENFDDPTEQSESESMGSKRSKHKNWRQRSRQCNLITANNVGNKIVKNYVIEMSMIQRKIYV